MRDDVQLSDWWYLSFATDAHFLGACVVRAGDCNRAITKAHELGINPGGGVIGIQIPEGQVPYPEHRHRLLKREEVARIWPGGARKIGPDLGVGS